MPGFMLAVYVFMMQAKFGKAADGARLELIKNSPNFKNGSFQNLSPTPSFTEGANFVSVLKEFLFKKNKRVKPTNELPSKKTDLHNLSPDKDVLVWFGHSSYFMQIDGKRILVDPVFSGSASPVTGTARSFKGSDAYCSADIPEIDFLFITHDHWDHLDYETILKIRPKARQVICSLGVGAHLEYWGYDKNKIVEMNWHQQVTLDKKFVVNTVPSRHFSGRKLKRNQTVWSSFAVKTPTMNVFIGGDSGYDSHFKDAGTKFGPFDLAILECGQYDKSWKYIHMMPEETVQAAKDLKAENLLAVHWGKFALANHNWDDPVKRVTAASIKEGQRLWTPIIGEVISLKEPGQKFSSWWEGVNELIG